MKKLTSNEIRTLWLKFFEDKGHHVVPSASLIPVDDNSLLWINSGVATLKKYFEGLEEPPCKRLTNSQKAIRTGDIENVGITTRHHTFFEMLGNFSIGDYFKEEAIAFGWELLTSEEYFAIPAELLYITVFDEDEDAAKFWEAQGVLPERIFKMSRDTNFWDMGKGPCGPSTEIFFDKGEAYDSRSAAEVIVPDLENDRYVEIWNIVFSQFNNDGEKNYTELPQQNIDTGAGLERIVSALQGKPTNFETDLFVKIIEAIDNKTKYNYLYDYIPAKLLAEDEKQYLINSWFKKIADFIRSVSFAISDGAVPDNVGRGYILRMLLRKAVINKNKLEIKENFLHELVEPLVETMGEHYPLLISKKDTIIEIIKREEEQFNNTLSSAIERMNKHIEDNTLNEETAYTLHETFGLPLELLQDITISRDDVNLDWKVMERLDEEFKAKSRSDNKADAMKIQDDVFVGVGETKFLGYEELESTSKVTFVSEDFVVFDQTPMYATSGGQAHDMGKANDFDVVGVEKNAEKTFIHNIPGHNFAIGDEVNLVVDKDRRFALSKHHTSHHLIAYAMDVVMEEQMPQNSFKAEPNYIRYAVVSQKKFDDELVQKAQDLANKWITEGHEVIKEEVPIAEAKERGAIYLQGAEYGEMVRIVTIKDLVVDMCGGTHIDNISQLEEVLITSYTKKGSGVWSFDAVAGKENVARALVETNNEAKEAIAKPLLNKVKALTAKMEDIGFTKDINFEERINSLDDSTISYKRDIQDLTKVIGKEISEISNELLATIEQNIIETSKDVKVFVKESTIFNVQEITRPLLSVIDGTDLNLGVVIINNGDKVTFGFVLSKDNVNETNVDRIKAFAEANNLRGNGKKQQYIFGGSSVDTSKLIEEIKGWEF